MKTYKISREYWSTFQNFNNIEEAEAWALEKIGAGCLVEISTDFQIVPPTPEEKLEMDIQFGQQLIKEFLKDNRLIQPPVTPYESLELLTKFQNIEKLANLGDIKSVRALLYNIEVDDRLFTQERKNRYLSTIDGYQ